MLKISFFLNYAQIRYKMKMYMLWYGLKEGVLILTYADNEELRCHDIDGEKA